MHNSVIIKKVKLALEEWENSQLERLGLDMPLTPGGGAGGGRERETYDLYKKNNL